MENEVKGIHLRGVKSRQAEQAGDLISQLDIHVDCGEILVGIQLIQLAFASLCFLCYIFCSHCLCGVLASRKGVLSDVFRTT